MKRIALLLSILSYAAFSSSEAVNAHPSFSENTRSKKSASLTTTTTTNRRNLKSRNDWLQLGDLIFNGDAVDSAYDGTGHAIASSADGTIIVLGQPFQENNAGKVEVKRFDEKKDGWVSMGQSIIGEKHGDQFGHAVAMSGDAFILIASSPGALNGRGSVRTYLYDDEAERWNQIGITIEGEVDREGFGFSLAMEESGDLFAVGAPDAPNTPGKVRVYEYGGGNDQYTWLKVGKDIIGEEEMDEAGHTVDIIQVGAVYYVAVGAPMDLESEGTATVFKFNFMKDDHDDRWSVLGRYVDGDAMGTDLGQSVNLGYDGKNLILAVGFPGPGIDKDSNIKSGVQAYKITLDGDWDFYGQMIFPVEENDQTGYKVSLSRDGQKLAITSPQYGDASGLFRVYEMRNKQYVQIGSDVVGDEYDELGFSVVLSRDGNMVSVGSISGRYVVTYSTLLSTVGKSVLSIIMTTFLIAIILAGVAFAGVKVVRRIKRDREQTFRTVHTEENTAQMRSYPPPIHQQPILDDDLEEDDDDDDGSEVSYGDDEENYESHLKTII